MQINIKKLRNTQRLPEYQQEGAAACDLYADIGKSIVLEPKESRLIGTGIAIEIPTRDIVALVYARSGLACKSGIALANSVGVIDSDYRGEVKVCLVNNSDKAFEIEPGMRVAQLCFTPVIQAKFNTVDSLGDTARGEGGFGSTGKG